MYIVLQSNFESVITMGIEEISTMKNLKNRKLYLQVYDEIKNYIIQNQLKPGDKLPTEMEMSAVLGVSRNVLREAIKSLEITGIVCSKPGVGIIIQEFSTDFLFQSLFYNLAGDSSRLLLQTIKVRRILELGFMRQGFDTLEPEDIEKLKDQVAVMNKAFRETQKKGISTTVFGHEFYAADAAFHIILFSKTDNDILKSIIAAVWSCDRYHKQKIQTTYIQKSVEKHEKIVQALVEHDFQKFSDAMHYHFDVSYKSDFENEV